MLTLSYKLRFLKIHQDYYLPRSGKNSGLKSLDNLKQLTRQLQTQLLGIIGILSNTRFLVSRAPVWFTCCIILNIPMAVLLRLPAGLF